MCESPRRMDDKRLRKWQQQGRKYNDKRQHAPLFRSGCAILMQINASRSGISLSAPKHSPGVVEAEKICAHFSTPLHAIFYYYVSSPPSLSSLGSEKTAAEVN